MVLGAHASPRAPSATLTSKRNTAHQVVIDPSKANLAERARGDACAHTTRVSVYKSRVTKGMRKLNNRQLTTDY